MLQCWVSFSLQKHAMPFPVKGLSPQVQSLRSSAKCGEVNTLSTHSVDVWTKLRPFLTFSDSTSRQYLCVSTEIWLKFVPEGQITIREHWVRWWSGTEHATIHYLNRRRPSLLQPYSAISPQWSKLFWYGRIYSVHYLSAFSELSQCCFPFTYHTHI